MSEYGGDYSSEASGLNFDESEDDLSLSFEYDESEEEHDNGYSLGNTFVYYTHAPRTNSGKAVDRMKYIPVNYEDIQTEIQNKAKKLDNMLQLGWEVCLVLLIKYNWNDHVLIERYMSDERDRFLRSNGVIINESCSEGSKLVSEETDPNFMCSICYCGPEANEPMDVFNLPGCQHKFCIDCYKHYVSEQNENLNILIKCPFSDPVCLNYITLSGLKELSEFVYNNEQIEKNLIDKQKQSGTHFLTEEEVMNKYQNNSDSDDSFLYTKDEKDEETLRDEKEKEENIIFNYQLEMLQKERNERIIKINRTLYSKYFFNVAKLYAQTNSKNIKSCSAPDCDGIIQCLGFDSNDIVNIGEMKEKMLIPIVQCINKHKFCYACNGEMDHSPCPCKYVATWKQKCKDDSETLNWISTNTKHCPKCSNAIEKNGGCNHMTCRSCRYEFCWICLGDWKKHRDNYNCDQYTGDTTETTEKISESKRLLEKYLFYYSRFDNQRTSYEKDKALLEKFEARILKLQKKLGVSYIDTMFYRDCIDVLLAARINLMWSYAFLYYLKPCTGKSLMETNQCSFSNVIEGLSHLFEHTKIEDVMKSKGVFLQLKGKILLMQPKFLDMSIELILSKECSFNTR